MKAIVIERHGPPEILKVVDVPPPKRGANEVLVRVRACALNHLDIWVRKGVEGHKFPLPIIPGSDVAGVIEEGETDYLKKGDEVVVAPFETCGHCEMCLQGNDVQCREYRILGESRDGGCAELVSVKAGFLFPKPKNLSFAEASSILLAPLTAYHMVVTRAKVEPKEDVLVTGASGGVGSSAIQIATILGANVFALVSNDEKAKFAKTLGAKDCIIYKEDTPLDQLFGKMRFDCVVDSVGGKVFEQAMRLLRPFGRLVTCGATSSPTATLDLRRLFFRSLSVLGSTMGSRFEMLKVLKWAEEGIFRPFVHKVLPLEEASTAHRIIEERGVLGKVVLEVS
jgi:NADPH:quinone reductase-like Zn-dependent oxidoreductase